MNLLTPYACNRTIKELKQFYGKDERVGRIACNRTI